MIKKEKQNKYAIFVKKRER